MRRRARYAVRVLALNAGRAAVQAQLHFVGPRSSKASCESRFSRAAWRANRTESHIGGPASHRGALTARTLTRLVAAFTASLFVGVTVLRGCARRRAPAQRRRERVQNKHGRAHHTVRSRLAPRTQ